MHGSNSSAADMLQDGGDRNCAWIDQDINPKRRDQRCVGVAVYKRNCPVNAVSFRQKRGEDVRFVIIADGYDSVRVLDVRFL